jgi:hypothetical protein
MKASDLFVKALDNEGVGYILVFRVKMMKPKYLSNFVAIPPQF